MSQIFKAGKPANPFSGVTNTGQCNCFTGTAYLESDGSCHCTSNANIPAFPFNGSVAEQISWRNTYLGGGVNPDSNADGAAGGVTFTAGDAIGGVKPPRGMTWTPAGWVPVRTVSNTKGAAADNTILGFSPWVVLGAVAAGLWLISSMDGEKKKAKAA